MKRSTVVSIISGLLLAGSLLLTSTVNAQGPVGRGMSPARRTALVTVQYGQWAWGCAYSDSLSIYAGVKAGYRVGTAAASRFLTPRFAR